MTDDNPASRRRAAGQQPPAAPRRATTDSRLAAASQQTREELLEAGLRLLLRLPASAAFGHLTANKIATEAGRTSGAFFHQWSTLDAYLDDFVAYVLRPELAVNLVKTAETIFAGLQEGMGFAEALIRAGQDVPQRTAKDAQTIIELLMWNRALHDEDFRQRVSRHYDALDAGAAPIFEGLMAILKRTPRPPFTPETMGAVITAIAEGLAVRAYLSPGFYPEQLFGWIVAALTPLFTREEDDERDATQYVVDLPLHLHLPDPNQR
jgi:AcrR family transcriptional regulator